MNVDDQRGIPQNIRAIRRAQLFREIPAVFKIREHINNANSIIACNYRGMLPMALCLVFANIVGKLTYYKVPNSDMSCLEQSCFLLNYISVISSMFINKFGQKCQYYYTLLDQSIPLVTVTSIVSLLTIQLCIKRPVLSFF